MKNRIISIIWMILAAACIAYGIAVVLVGSGKSFFIVWFLGAGVFILFAVAAWFHWWSKLPKAVRVVLLSLLGICLAVFLTVEGLILSKFDEKAPDGVDYLIVLGAQVREDGPSQVLKYRLDETIEYMKKNPETKCIVTGMKGYNEPTTEAEGMAKYLKEKGIAEERIIEEPHAYNTNENILFSMELMEEDSTSAIVTNNFHLYRAMGIAKKQGLEEAYGIAAGSTPFYLPHNMVREFYGIIKDVLVGNLAF